MSNTIEENSVKSKEEEESKFYEYIKYLFYAITAALFIGGIVTLTVLLHKHGPSSQSFINMPLRNNVLYKK